MWAGLKSSAAWECGFFWYKCHNTLAYVVNWFSTCFELEWPKQPPTTKTPMKGYAKHTATEVAPCQYLFAVCIVYKHKCTSNATASPGHHDPAPPPPPLIHPSATHVQLSHHNTRLSGQLGCPMDVQSVPIQLSSPMGGWGLGRIGCPSIPPSFHQAPPPPFHLAHPCT